MHVLRPHLISKFLSKRPELRTDRASKNDTSNPVIIPELRPKFYRFPIPDPQHWLLDPHAFTARHHALTARHVLYTLQHPSKTRLICESMAASLDNIKPNLVGRSFLSLQNLTPNVTCSSI